MSQRVCGFDCEENQLQLGIQYLFLCTQAAENF